MTLQRTVYHNIKIFITAFHTKKGVELGGAIPFFVEAFAYTNDYSALVDILMTDCKYFQSKPISNTTLRSTAYHDKRTFKVAFHTKKRCVVKLRWCDPFYHGSSCFIPITVAR